MPFQKGRPPAIKGQGKGVLFLRQHIGHDGNGCLIWPFARRDGYGQFGHEGKLYRAHRWMCEAAHGAPLSPRHEAAHSCGNHGCVNPRHLSWKTSAENHADLVRHGRARTGKGRTFHKLTLAQVRVILASKGRKSARELGLTYGVTERYIRQIWQGVNWRGGVQHKPGGGIVAE